MVSLCACTMRSPPGKPFRICPLPQHFARHKKTTAQEAQFRNALRSKAEQGTTVSDELLDTAVDIQLAETVPLVVNR